ncbi:MAG TPA: hypothetical protein VHF69_06550 [Candidatus Synoicihabitans sp.]|nr:hypothetical protein [Candidatus Synoicihabitans sp.]
MVRLVSHARALALVLLLVHSAGCATRQLVKREELGPVFAPRNVTSVSRWWPGIDRVVVLPTADASGKLPTTFAATFDQTWLRALQSSQRAEFVGLDRTLYSQITASPSPPASTSILPHAWAERVKAATEADAALLVDVTQVSPYPPLILGWRLKLVHLPTGEILWAADEVFDAGDPAVARAARRHARAGASGRDGDAIAVLQSPSRYGNYTVDALVALLPPR